ncbi:hypothetical protein DFQ26_005744 [Actinomortierella ambigua]|nr:hypothetical protein DFQ26_005744 [Actinomortierella ambigua]
MKKSFLFLGIFAALSLVAAESPADTASKINSPVEKRVVPGSEGFTDNFAYVNEQPVLQGEKYQFQTEVSRLMNIVINSLYKTPEIFLRELISNGSDALDKIRFKSLTDPSALDSNPSLNVTIAAHKNERVLTITDSGIGMTKQDLQNNLGTIAKSGTSEFLDALAENSSESVDLIGKFGVGFYSVFLVADKVRVTSKHNDDDQYIWESTAVNDFTIAKDPRGNTLGRGTQIAIYLKPDQGQYLEERRLSKLVEKYSEFISFPIYLRREKTKTIETPVEPVSEKKADDESEDPTVETEEEDKAKQPQTKKEKVTFLEDDLVNSNKPIWMRDPKEVSVEEYVQFYKVVARDQKATPMAYSHFRAEGDVDFKAIIYIPREPPKDLYRRVDNSYNNVKLYVKRVFITDESQEFLPRWLSFLKVVVDAEDAPLNVSRETVQSSKSVKSIKKRLTKKVFDLLRELSKDEEKYAEFIKHYGTSLKLGALDDRANKAKIAKLLRYKSASSVDGETKMTSLDDYIARMKVGQKDIYYFTGLNAAEIKQSPFVEALLARGYEVLFMDDPADEIVVNTMQDFEGHSFQNVGKADLKLGDEDEAAKQQLEQEYAPIVDWIQTTLSKEVEKVRLSSRLTTSPAALVAPTYGWTANMEKLMETSAKQNRDQAMNSFYRMQKKILEINPGHPLIKGMLARAQKDPKDGLEKDAQFQEMARILYEITLIRSGYSLKDGVKDFAGRVENMLRVNLGVDMNAQAEYEAPAAESRPQSEIDEDIKQRKEQEEKQARLDSLPGADDDKDDEDEKEGMSVDELNEMIKEITDDVPSQKVFAHEQPELVKKVLDVDDVVADSEKELDAEDATDAQKTTHDEL